MKYVQNNQLLLYSRVRYVYEFAKSLYELLKRVSSKEIEEV
jgi:hypothetical protein